MVSRFRARACVRAASCFAGALGPKIQGLEGGEPHLADFGEQELEGGPADLAHVPLRAGVEQKELRARHPRQLDAQLWPHVRLRKGPCEMLRVDASHAFRQDT